MRETLDVLLTFVKPAMCGTALIWTHPYASGS